MSLTRQTHHSFAEALPIAGLGRCTIRHILIDGRYWMQPASLVQTIEQDRAHGLLPWVVVMSAGTMDTGWHEPAHQVAVYAGKLMGTRGNDLGQDVWTEVLTLG